MSVRGYLPPHNFTVMLLSPQLKQVVSLSADVQECSFEGLLATNAGSSFISDEAIILSRVREVKPVMANLEQIEAAILSLPSTEFEKLRLWFLDLDYDRWDEQIEQDIEDGKLEALAQKAIPEFESGHCQEI